MILKIKIAFLLLTIPLTLLGQQSYELINDYIEQIIEQNITSKDGEMDIESIVADLEFLYANPLNINTAKAEEFDKLWILNEFQIRSLLEYRRNMNQFVSLKELSYIYGFTTETVNLILPFIYIGKRKDVNKTSVEDVRKSLNHEIIARLQQKSVKDPKFIGNAQKYYTRYKLWYEKKYSFGFLVEKDAGEEFFKGSNSKGFDFYSAYFKYTNKNFLNTIIVGDYRFRAGQGLLIWPGYSSGKSSQVNSIQKRGQGISGNNSSDEFSFFRGTAITLGKNKTKLNLFFSYKPLDTTIDSLEDGIYIKTIRTDGLHRTTNEINYEKNAYEKSSGARLSYSSNSLFLGANLLNTQYTIPIIESDKLYKKYHFSGESIYGISADYKILLPRIQFFGELAYANNAWAALSGLNLMPHPQFFTTIAYRNYQQSYYSPYFNGLSESSSITGERGVFAGFQWNTDWNIKLSAYADVYSFPWLQYSANGPSKGKDYLLEGCYSSLQSIDFSLRYKFEKKEKNYLDKKQIGVRNIKDFEKQSLRFQLRYYLSEKTSMTTRFEISKSGYSSEEKFLGYLLYQDVVWRPIEKIQINFRHAWFDISDYNSRIYAYEHNARYAYSMPAYYSKGTKTYLLFRFKASSKLTIWLRYGYTNFFDDELTDEHKGTFQVILRF